MHDRVLLAVSAEAKPRLEAVLAGHELVHAETFAAVRAALAKQTFDLIIVEELVAALRNVEGMAMILVEQHAEIALSLTEQALVIERGRIAHAGPSAELLSNQTLLERYVGVQSTELS